MSQHAIHNSFQSLDSAAFSTYATALLDSYPTAEQRKQAVSYLQMVNSADSVSLRAERVTLDAKRSAQWKKQLSIETLLAAAAFDFSKQPALFQTQAALSDAELATLCTQDDKEIYVRNLARVGDLTISGDGILLDGQSSGGSARSESLATTASVTGSLHIAGDNTTIKGITFNSASKEKAITFGVGAENVTFVNCKFIAGDHADSKWFYGENLGGSVTLTNCRVEGFQSWYLADFSSTSGEPQAATTKIRMKRCHFKNNLGSIASRGKTGAPTKLVQYSNNLLVTDTIHASFWDFLEINNCLKAIVENNEAIAPVNTETTVGKRGFFQCWSKEPKPWTLKYSGNKISNLKVGGKCALNNGFYSPNTSDEDDFLIDLSETLTNVTYSFSFLYKKNDGTTASADKWTPAGLGNYSPVNISTFPTPPSTVNPSGYAVVTL